MSLILFALGAGCLWHGLQIVWVAPTPRQFRQDVPEVPAGSPQAFQLFWLDQYAWIGIALSVIGLALVGAGFLW